jgi:hypothetical protein
MANPIEILVGPLTLYAAPVGEAMPAVGVTPAGNWSKIGTSGDKNYSEDGVTITHSQTVDLHFVAGSTGPVKATRSQEGLMVAVTLHDLKAAEYTRIIDNVSPTVVAAGSGTIGTTAIQLRKGTSPAEFALLVRGEAASPQIDGGPLQYEVPRCFKSGDDPVVYNKGSMTALTMEFTALEDPAASTDAERFGQLIYKSANAL